jgi:hypothetical protein
VTGVFFFGKLGFPFLINLYFLYNYSNNLEKGTYLTAFSTIIVSFDDITQVCLIDVPLTMSS